MTESLAQISTVEKSPGKNPRQDPQARVLSGVPCLLETLAYRKGGKPECSGLGPLSQ